MKGRHFAPPDKSKKRRKSIVLSIVALLELLLLVTSITFSWFEGLTSLEMSGSGISTPAALNSHLEVGENPATNNEVYSEIIDLTRFFDAQKEVRLSPVSSSDAVNFYAPYDGTPTKNNYKTTQRYRQLTKEDINANIIQFEFNISSPHGPTDVYLTEIMPVVYINGTPYYSPDYKDANGTNYSGRFTNPYRFAFSDGTTTHILRNEDSVATNVSNCTLHQPSIKSLNADGTANEVLGSFIAPKSAGVVERVQEYAYYSDHRTTVTSYDNSTAPIKPLFSLNKGDTKTITVSVWYEALDQECINSNTNRSKPGDEISFSVKLCTTWSITEEITVFDYTATQWIDKVDTVKNDGKEMSLYVRNADSNQQRLYKLEYDEDTKTWTGEIPKAVSNCEFIWAPVSNTADRRTVWKASNRNGNSFVTMLGNNTAVWGLDPADLTQIYFRDYTSSSWINNPDDNGAPITMFVNIVYNGRMYEYRMSDNPELDENGKNSWTCYIPSSVDTVQFNRCEHSTSTKIYNYWLGTDRGDSTIYRAIETSGGNTGTDETFTLYISIDESVVDKFYYGNYTPSISFPTISNQAAWSNAQTSADGFASFDRTTYKPFEDTWPNGNFGMTRVDGEDNLWYVVLDSKPVSGQQITIWNRNDLTNFNAVDKNTSFGIFEYDGSSNTIKITSVTEITASNAYNNFILKGSLAVTDSTGEGNIPSDKTAETGMWMDDLDLTGTYTTTFVHTAVVDKVTVIYDYNGILYYVDMTKGTDGKSWTTDKIPDEVVSAITFRDNLGNEWKNTYTRLSTKSFYYVTAANGTSSTGKWRAELALSGSKSYFKHYGAVNSMQVSFTYDGIPVTVNLDGSNNLWHTDKIPNSGASNIKYTDGTNTWTMGTKDTSKLYCYAISKNQAQYGTANMIRIYYTNNYSWTDNYIHYWGGSSDSSWPGLKLTSVAKNSSNQEVFCGLIPSNSTGIIFNGKNSSGTRLQTGNITTNITDMKGFYISGGSNNNHTAGTWNVDATFLNTYSK